VGVGHSKSWSGHCLSLIYQYKVDLIKRYDMSIWKRCCTLILINEILSCWPWTCILLHDKDHTRIDDCCVSSWFCSHPVGSYLQDQEWMTDPFQDRLSSNLTISPWHHSPSSSTYLTNDGSPLQWNRATSPLKSHIIIKSYSRGLQWDFCWKSTGNWPRSWVQD